MTPRRRRPTGGSSSSSGSDNTPDTRRPTGGTGGDGVGVDADRIDTMAGRLENTGGRVDAVGSTVGNVNVGPQSMGVVGSGFTGAAQTHLSNAQQQVARTRQAVQNAQAGTSSTARTYRDTEATNTENLGGIDTSTDVPTTRGDSTTTPSSSSGTPTGDGTSNPPPARGDSGGPPPGGGDNSGGGGGSDRPPNSPGTPGDGPGDGSWRGDNGLELTPAQNAAADDFLRRAQGAEPRITQSMTDISNSVPGSQMVGLDYRLKTEDSFKRKLATAIQENPDLPVSAHLADMKDSVRYTMQVDQDYSRGVQHAVDTMLDQGYEPVKFKNFWGGEGYQGINSMWRDPQTGQVFEVQFHTQDSFDAKMTTHELYEQARLPDTTPEERDRLNQQQDETFNGVPRPPGAADISPHNRESRP